MSLARTAVRLLAVGVMTGTDGARPTIAGPRVYDSRISDLAPETFAEDAKPVLLVLTDEDSGEALSDANGGPPFRRLIELVIEMAMVERHKVGDGYVVGYPDTDARLEASLDLLEHQVLDVLGNGTTDAALTFQSHIRVWRRAAHRQVTDDAGVKMACRILSLTCEISDDQGGPMPGATGLDRLPEPLRTVAHVLPPGSGGANTCSTLAAAISAQPDISVPFEGVDWRFDAGTEDKDEHVVVGKTDFDQP
ncbi:MAG TPA: hypothetical protein VNQ99_17635 [Xanthobacteraceae bacterium]|nr:hypothetical protein [Xanthobacteraceae bacterium]